MQSGLLDCLVPRLSPTATQQLQYVQEVIAGTELTEDSDKRSSPFRKNASGLDSGAIYQLLKARGQPADDRAKFAWRNSAPPRVQMFMWLLTRGRIQCRTFLHREHVLPDTICEICNEDETPEHIVYGCAIGAQFWEKTGLPTIKGTTVDNLHRLNPPREVPKEEYSAFVALSCWQLWKTRNAAVFRNERHNISQVTSYCSMQGSGRAMEFQASKKKEAHPRSMVPGV